MRRCGDEVTLLQRLTALLLPALLAAGCGGDATAPKTCGGPGIICTVAGVHGIAGYNGDNIAMSSAFLYWPQDMAVSAAGELVVLDWNNHRVRGCDLATNKITTVLGSGRLGDDVDKPALDVDLNHPTGVTWDPQGRMILSAWHNWKIKRLDPDGVVRKIVGTSQGFAGDAFSALDAKLDLPSSVVFDGDGNMYISDQGNGRIRKVDLDGDITTWAGKGGQGFEGDDGLAVLAQFNFPKGSDAVPAGKIAIGPDKDEIYVADTNNNRIRVIDIASRRIRTFAGNGEEGYSGDGGPAFEARLHHPTDVAVGPDHSVYIADSQNHVIRRIDPLGTITTVAGTGTAGFSGDGGAATEARLDTPSGVFVDGNVLYIADTNNHVVRRVELP